MHATAGVCVLPGRFSRRQTSNSMSSLRAASTPLAAAAVVESTTISSYEPCRRTLSRPSRTGTWEGACDGRQERAGRPQGSGWSALLLVCTTVMAICAAISAVVLSLRPILAVRPLPHLQLLFPGNRLRSSFDTFLH